MPQLEIAKCPCCGAQVPVDPKSERVKCDYCGTASAIHRSAEAPPHGAAVIVIRPHSSANLALLLGLAAVIVVGIIAYIALTRQESISNPPSETSEPRASRRPDAPPPPKGSKPEEVLRVNPTPIVLTDVKGDGSKKIVASIALRTGGTSSRHFAVFDAKTGALEAKTPALEVSSDLLSGVLGNRLVLAKRRGEVAGYDLGSGKVQWTTSLGEEVAGLCDPLSPGAVLVETESRHLLVDLVTGRQNETPHPCTELLARSFINAAPSDRRDWSAPAGTVGIRCGSLRVMGSQDYTVPDACRARAGLDPANLEGMVAHRLWRVEKGWLAFGVRKPGHVPMAGRLERGRFVWKTEVPAKNPLDAEEGGPRFVALAGDELAITYEDRREGRTYLTALALTDGARRFTVQLPQGFQKIHSLCATADTLVVQGGDGLLLLESRDGSTRATVPETSPKR